MAIYRWIVFLLVAAVFSSCSFTNPELLRMEQLNVTKFSEEGVELAVKAKVKNPNNYKVSLVNSKLDIYVNNEFMGKAHLKNNVRFKRKSTDTYLIELVNKPENFAKLGMVSLFSLFGNKKLKVTVRGEVKGRVGILSKKN